jgi:hypothetical protein
MFGWLFRKKKPKDLVEQLKLWLGPEGIEHFRDLKEKHGKIDCVYMKEGIPHPVHFREGLVVRNKLRQLTNYSWTDHEYDERWLELVEKAIV